VINKILILNLFVEIFVDNFTDHLFKFMKFDNNNNNNNIIYKVSQFAVFIILFGRFIKLNLSKYHLNQK
jgi:hypothetical protein